MSISSHRSTDISEVIEENELLPTARFEDEPALPFAFMTALTRLLTTATDLDNMLNQGLSQIVTAFPGAANAALYLQYEQGGGLTMAARYPHSDEASARSRVKLATEVAEYLKPITLMVRHAADGPYSPVLGVPICTAGRTLGALIIEADARIFSDRDTELLTLVAAQLALAIENYQLRRAAHLGGLHEAGSILESGSSFIG